MAGPPQSILLRAAALLLACFTGALAAAQEARPSPSPLILVSFDGWRWDYHTRFPAPNVSSVIARGVRAENLIPSFPSKTFPNHYTLVTGLYPGHHGLVANTIKDPGTGRWFSLSNRREVQDPMWWGGEPLWVTLQATGQLAATMFWPGSEAPIRGQRPRYWMEFDESLPGTARVDRILGWLALPAATRPAFLTLYFEDVDTAAHNRGPDSSAVRDAVQRVDGYLGRLLRGLERLKVLDTVNIVLTSDHGLAETSMSRVVVLDDYISLDDVEIVEVNPTLGLLPKAGREEAVYQALSAAHPRMKVYRRRDTPVHWHYRDHPRIPALVGVADEGWQILRRATLVERIGRRLLGPRGEHGYDPHQAMSMRALFVAAGPAFRRGVTVPAFENVHVYNALAEALGVTPTPNDGNPAIARSLLRTRALD
jgi:predicted AlkP superfamily pyrophosphatase or phosphodiesterase